METKNLTILPKQMMRYEGMTPAQLLSLILLCNEESSVALWYMLSVRFQENLQMCYLQLSKDVTNDIKTFDDYLTDFYLYLYEGHPDYVTGPTQFHYLKTITDNTRIDSWMQKCFRQFISNERRALEKLTKALPAYVVEQKYEHLKDPQIELTRIAFSLAWFNQFEPVLNRYIFFRSMKKKVTKSFNRREELSDEETAQALGMNYAAYRSKSSRCCKEVQRLMTEMKKEDFAKLDANSLLLVDRICNIDERTLDSIVDSLMTGAERQLPQYADLVEARMRKVEECFDLSRELSELVLPREDIVLENRPASFAPQKGIGSAMDGSPADTSWDSPWKSIVEKIKPSKKSSRASEKRPQKPKKTFVETFVENFKSFLSV